MHQRLKQHHEAATFERTTKCITSIRTDIFCKFSWPTANLTYKGKSTIYRSVIPCVYASFSIPKQNKHLLQYASFKFCNEFVRHVRLIDKRNQQTAKNIDETLKQSEKHFCTHQPPQRLCCMTNCVRSPTAFFLPNKA